MNEWQISFPTCIDYRNYDEITVEINLISDPLFTAVKAKLDTGSKHCIFQPRYARWLGLD